MSLLVGSPPPQAWPAVFLPPRPAPLCCHLCGQSVLCCLVSVHVGCPPGGSGLPTRQGASSRTWVRAWPLTHSLTLSSLVSREAVQVHGV